MITSHITCVYFPNELGYTFGVGRSNGGYNNAFFGFFCTFLSHLCLSGRNSSDGHHHEAERGAVTKLLWCLVSESSKQQKLRIKEERKEERWFLKERRDGVSSRATNNEEDETYLWMIKLFLFIYFCK